MKRMIDNKDYDALKKDVKDVSDIVEEHTTDFVIKSVVYEDEEVKGFQISDVKNEIDYNIDLSGGAKTLYQHNIRLYSSSDKYNIMVQVINDSETLFTLDTLAAYLKSKGFTDTNKLYPCTGVQRPTNSLAIINLIYTSGQNAFPTAIGGKIDGTESTLNLTYASITDIVITL